MMNSIFQMMKIPGILIGCLFSLPAFAQDSLPNSAFVFGADPNAAASTHYYFGIEPGIGQASGTQYPLNSGYVYGFTFGMEQKKAFGFALTYQHNGLAYADSGIKTSIHQIIAEANVFSLLVLHGGFHLADVIKLQPGVRTADLGFGLHIGLDVTINAHLTAGITGYWTLVMEQDDHHSLINLMLPLKYWW